MQAWIASILKSYRLPLLTLVLLQLGAGLLVALQPRYFQQVVSLAVEGQEVDLWQAGLPLLILLASIYVALTLLQVLSGYIGSHFSFNLLRQLQTEFFEKISRVPLSFFQHQSPGEIFTTFNTDIGQAQRFFADFCPSLARELITATGVVVILFVTCPAGLTLAAVGIALASAVLVLILNRRLGRYANAQRSGWGEINRIFDETVQGIDTLKVMAAEDRQRTHFEVRTAELRKISVRAGALWAVGSPLIDLLSKLGGLGLFASAYYLFASGAFQLGPFFLFFFYSALLQMSVGHLTGMMAALPAEVTGIRNLSAFLTENAEAQEGPATERFPGRSVDIEFSSLTFSFPGGRRLYRQADLVVPANAVTVVQGESGAGKSTLINLLLRFYEPHQGKITLGGVDIRLIARAELRGKIGVVTQNHFIFQETLRANLLISRPEATDRELWQAIERAQLSEFLDRLPQGLETVMDPRGYTISAGERQRICIARLLLRESSVMILDEPWSNLDARACRLLAEVINICKTNSTVLVLTHELPSTLEVDYLYRLDAKQGIFVEPRSGIIALPRPGSII